MTKKRQPAPAKALPKKDWRQAYLNAGFFEDENGTLWGENAYVLPDGSGETFGPGHPNRPAMLETVRTRNHKGAGEGPVESSLLTSAPEPSTPESLPG